MKRYKSFVLIGFQASGKTTLGNQLANCLQCSFMDTDQLVEQFHPGWSCREIFQHFGSSHFRNLEWEAISSLSFCPSIVLATGGGTLLETKNGMLLKAHGNLIYLKTSAEVLKKRIWQRQVLPAYLTGEDPELAFTQLYQERILVYEKWADQTLEMDHLTEEKALTELLRIVN